MMWTASAFVWNMWNEITHRLRNIRCFSIVFTQVSALGKTFWKYWSSIYLLPQADSSTINFLAIFYERAFSLWPSLDPSFVLGGSFYFIAHPLTGFSILYFYIFWFGTWFLSFQSNSTRNDYLLKYDTFPFLWCFLTVPFSLEVASSTTVTILWLRIRNLYNAMLFSLSPLLAI